MPTTTTMSPAANRVRRRSPRSSDTASAGRTDRFDRLVAFLAGWRRNAGPSAAFWLPSSLWTTHLPRPPRRP